MQTAKAVAGRHALPVEIVEALDEIDFGEWAGQSFASLETKPEWRAWNAERGSAATPGGETMRAATMRAVRLVESFAETEVVVCVSHCDIIRGIVAHYLSLPLERLLTFGIDPASCTTIAFDGGVARVVAINERVS